MNKINININQQYGNMDLPSQIIDSFQESRELDENYGQEQKQQEQQHHGHRQRQIDTVKYSRYFNENAQQQHEYSYYQPQDIPNISFQSSIQDTFLANLPLLTNPNNPHSEHQREHEKPPQILLNKTKIQKSVLPQQQVIEHVQIINTSDSVTILTVICPEFIEIISEEGYYRNGNENENYNANRNQGWFDNFGIKDQLNVNKSMKSIVKEFYLESYQKLNIPFKIIPREHELGDLYQTIILQTKAKSQLLINVPNFSNQPQSTLHQKQTTTTTATRKHRSYIEVQIHYVTPKLKIYYEGCADVCTLATTSTSSSLPSSMNSSLTNNKISINKISKNKFGEYNMMLQANGLQRMECRLQARGQISVFPNQLLFFDEDKKKISFKCKNISSNNAKANGNSKYGKGVLIVKVKGCKSSFVLAIELLQ